MKKLFTLAFAVLASFSLWAADVKTYTFDDDVLLATDWDVVTDIPSGGSATCEITDKLASSSFATRTPESKYLGLAYLNKSGIKIELTSTASYTAIEAISLDVVASDNSKPTFAIYVVTADGDEEVLAAIGSKDGFGTGGTNKWGHKDIDLSAKKLTGKIKIVTVASSSGKYAAIDNIKITYTDCTAPATPLTLKIDKTAPIYEGDVINLSTEGGNENPVKLKLDDADYKDWAWGAVKGEHTFIAYQEKNGEYCGQESELKLTVLEATPVTSVTVNGPTSGYVGVPMTFTVTAENATDYRWLVNGASVPGETGTSFTYTPTASATKLSIRCDAWNQFNGYSGEYKAWKSSDLHFVEVSILSGAILEFKAENGSGNIDKDVAAGGIIGGTAHQKTQKNGKLGSKGYYVSMTMASGSFLAEDTVRIIVKPEEDSKNPGVYKVPGTLKLSSALDNSDIIGEISGLTCEGAAAIVADIVLTKDAATIYLSRNDAVDQNPIVDSIVVIRPVDDGSPVLKVNKESVNVSVTAESPTATAKFAYFGKHLTPGTYSINTGSFPASAFWDYSPKNVTVGADGKLNEEISVTFNGEGGSGSTIPEYLSITFGLAINSQSVSTLVVCDFDMDKDYINASVNIEQLILDHGKSYDIVKDLMSAEINYLKIDALDSLADKEGRNEPYLGLKLQKATDAMIGGWVKKDDVLRVKFGNIPDAVLVTINDAAPVEITDHVYELTATEDTYVKFAPKGTGSKLVVKQIMLNEPIAVVVLPDDPTAIDNTEINAKAVKTIENGQLVIIKYGVKYSIIGAKL